MVPPRRIVLVAALSAVVLLSGMQLVSEAVGQQIHPAAVGIAAVNGYGSYDPTYFAPGALTGAIYFAASDYSGDTTGNVTLHDQNFTRDGLKDPVASWEISFNHLGENNSFGTSEFYQIPYTLNDSGIWTLNITAGTSSFGIRLMVITYHASVSTDSHAYLPGHSGTLNWFVSRTASGAPFSGFQTLQLLGVYETASATFALIPGLSHDLTVASDGSTAFTVPTDAMSGSELQFVLYANQTTGGTVSIPTSAYAGVVSITGVQIGFLNCEITCGYYTAGAPILVQIGVDTSGGFGNAQLGGINAHFVFMNGHTTVNPPSGTPTSLTTNASGLASFVLLANDTVFSTTQANYVQVNITDSLNPAVKAGNLDPFHVTTSPQAARLQVVFSAATYAGGDNATATWTLGAAVSGNPTGWTAGHWEADGSGSSTPHTFFGQGFIDSTATTGTLTISLPLNFRGAVWLNVTAYNQTENITTQAVADVVAPTLLINPSETVYSAGDSINVAVVTSGQVFGTASWYEETDDSSGNVLSAGTFSGSSFSVKVPSVAPPSAIYFYVAAQTTADGIIATASASSELQYGLTLALSVQTASSYSDGSYTPGQTVTISYTLNALGNTKLPTAMTLEIVPSSGLFGALYEEDVAQPGIAIYREVATSGTVSYTIPSDSANGLDSFVAVGDPLNGACSESYYSCVSITQLTVNVNSNPPALGLELGGSSGFTLGLLLVIILIIVVAIVGILWARRRMGGGRRSEPPKAFTSSPPPAAPYDENAGGAPPAGDGSSPPPSS